MKKCPFPTFPQEPWTRAAASKQAKARGRLLSWPTVEVAVAPLSALLLAYIFASTGSHKPPFYQSIRLPC